MRSIFSFSLKVGMMTICPLNDEGFTLKIKLANVQKMRWRSYPVRTFWKFMRCWNFFQENAGEISIFKNLQRVMNPYGNQGS